MLISPINFPNEAATDRLKSSQAKRSQPATAGSIQPCPGCRRLSASGHGHMRLDTAGHRHITGWHWRLAACVPAYVTGARTWVQGWAARHGHVASPPRGVWRPRDYGIRFKKFLSEFPDPFRIVCNRLYLFFHLYIPRSTQTHLRKPCRPLCRLFCIDRCHIIR